MILQRYLQAGGPATLGYPLNDESATANGGRFNKFHSGSIYFTEQTGAQVVRGKILDHWSNLGAELSYLGYPNPEKTRFQLQPAPHGHGFSEERSA